MKSKVFGIGWAKTGTTTLCVCFRELGFRHQSQRLDLVKDIARGDLSRVVEVAEEKESFEDWPWIILYREMDEAFPGSRFILTVREPQRWLRSYSNMLRIEGRGSEELNEIRRTLYGLPFPDVTEEQLLARYVEHNEQVVEYFQDRPRSLLVVDWASRGGWADLCEFLGVEVPEVPFPHANRGYYHSRMRFYLSRVFDFLRGHPTPHDEGDLGP